MPSKKITELNNEEARKYFMDERNYKTFDIPYYFHFTELLNTTASLISEKSIFELCKKREATEKLDFPKHHEDVNYTFLSNKDGAFAWRPLQLIHPVLYVDLVNTLTTTKNWEYLVSRFQSFAKSFVQCISIPRVSQDDDSHKASQVKNWWEEMEQRSIKMALKYDYVFATDITNCYGSIYTHSVEWALTVGGKDVVKRNKDTGTKTLGAEIDEKLRGMNYGQTNGIPQGSSLMDFIAEMILGYGDTELTNELTKEGIKNEDFHILRYRDDYRIFVNNPVIGHQILKKLNNVLFRLGMKMNACKTTEGGDVILSSIKTEKLERIFIAPIQQFYQKEALRIYQLSKKYPNSGLIAKELSVYYDRVERLKYFKNTDIEVIVSVFSMVAVNSPKEINWVSAIISIFLKTITCEDRRHEIIKMIHSKFQKIPNTSLIDVWLQRISAPLGVEINYTDNLTKVALQKIDNSQIWNSQWLNDEISKKINSVKISNLKEEIENKTISPVIPRSEVELFRLIYDD